MNLIIPQLEEKNLSVVEIKKRCGAFKRVLKVSDEIANSEEAKVWYCNAASRLMEIGANLDNREDPIGMRDRLEMKQVYQGDISEFVEYLRKIFPEYSKLNSWELIITVFAKFCGLLKGDDTNDPNFEFYEAFMNKINGASKQEEDMKVTENVNSAVNPNEDKIETPIETTVSVETPIEREVHEEEVQEVISEQPEILKEEVVESKTEEVTKDETPIVEEPVVEQVVEEVPVQTTMEVVLDSSIPIPGTTKKMVVEDTTVVSESEAHSEKNEVEEVRESTKEIVEEVKQDLSEAKEIPIAQDNQPTQVVEKSESKVEHKSTKEEKVDISATENRLEHLKKDNYGGNTKMANNFNAGGAPTNFNALRNAAGGIKGGMTRPMGAANGQATIDARKNKFLGELEERTQWVQKNTVDKVIAYSYPLNTRVLWNDGQGNALAGVVIDDADVTKALKAVDALKAKFEKATGFNPDLVYGKDSQADTALKDLYPAAFSFGHTGEKLKLIDEIRKFIYDSLADKPTSAALYPYNTEKAPIQVRGYVINGEYYNDEKLADVLWAYSPGACYATGSLKEDGSQVEKPCQFRLSIMDAKTTADTNKVVTEIKAGMQQGTQQPQQKVKKATIRIANRDTFIKPENTIFLHANSTETKKVNITAGIVVMGGLNNDIQQFLPASFGYVEMVDDPAGTIDEATKKVKMVPKKRTFSLKVKMDAYTPEQEATSEVPAEIVAKLFPKNGRTAGKSSANIDYTDIEAVKATFAGDGTNVLIEISKLKAQGQFQGLNSELAKEVENDIAAKAAEQEQKVAEGASNKTNTNVTPNVGGQAAPGAEEKAPETVPGGGVPGSKK